MLMVNFNVRLKSRSMLQQFSSLHSESAEKSYYHDLTVCNSLSGSYLVSFKQILSDLMTSCMSSASSAHASGAASARSSSCASHFKQQLHAVEQVIDCLYGVIVRSQPYLRAEQNCRRSTRALAMRTRPADSCHAFIGYPL